MTIAPASGDLGATITTGVGAGLSDDEVLAEAASRLSVPRERPADSFVLHAPLELLARSALLRRVDPAVRDAARAAVRGVADRFDASGPAIGEATDADDHVTADDLAAAVDGGDLDEIDRVAAALIGGATAHDLADQLTDLVVPRLAAAGHGAIFLYLLPRLAGGVAEAAGMARGLLRELGRHPDWQLTWFDEPEVTAGARGSADDLIGALLDPTARATPSSTFIHPTMSVTESTGLARDLLADPVRGLGVTDARRALLRVAAWSMLQDDPDHAPYGWSHALTMPQATLGVARSASDPRTAVSVAATYALGFRSTLGSTALDPQWVPAAPAAAGDPAGFLDGGPGAAAAAIWHADDGALPDLVRATVSFAATHEDAHLVKYTLACLDATRDDPGAGRLFLAAAGYLAGWWRVR